MAAATVAVAVAVAVRAVTGADERVFFTLTSLTCTDGRTVRRDIQFMKCMEGLKKLEIDKCLCPVNRQYKAFY